MNSLLLTRQQCRRLDREAIEHYGIPGMVLMENAGRGVADRLQRLGIDGPVLICCGKGNNAGDGFVIARHLDLRAVAVQVLLWADPAQLAGDAAANYRIIERARIPLEHFADGHDPARLQRHLDSAAWIVDALLGTGAQGDPRPPLDTVIDQLNASGTAIMAVDVPSGLDCDTGRPSAHAIRAAHTCTFLARKTGFNVPGAEHCLGTVHVLDIGAPRRLLEQMTAEP